MSTRYKKTHMGNLPGDVPIQEKAAMLEGTHPNKRRSRTFKKIMVKKAIRRLRKMRIEHPDDCVGYCCMDTSGEDAVHGTWIP